MTDEQIKRKIIAERKRKMRKRRIIVMCILTALVVVEGVFLGRHVGNIIADKSKVSEVADESAQDVAEEQSEPAREFINVAEDTPFLNVAMGEIGNVGGEKFWSWYGFGSRVSWCACYVSWCENQVGYQSDGKAPSFAVVTDGIDWFKARGQWLDSDATPSAGDLIFFDWEKDGYRDHVGIVTAVRGDKVFAVEGNSSDRCRIKSYYIGDFPIEGYGHIE